MHRTLAVLVALVMVAVSAAAQDRARFGTETVVNTVEVPVIVLNGDSGEPVTGLGVDDFRLSEGSVAQEISNFSEIIRFEPSSEPDSRRDAEASAVHMVYFVDLYLMISRDKLRVLEGLRARYGASEMVDEQVSIVSFDGRLRILLEQGREPEQVLAAIDELEQISAQGLHHVLSFPAAGSQRGIADENKLRNLERRQRSLEFVRALEERVEEVGTALSTTMARMAKSSGQAVVVAFSSGQPATERSPAFSPADYVRDGSGPPASALWREMALEAANLGFTLFVVDPAHERLPEDFESVSAAYTLGGNVRLVGAAVARRDAMPEQRTYDRAPSPASESLPQWLERTRRTLLASTTELTGGATVFDPDVGRAVDHVTGLLRHHYSLAYVPGHFGDGRTHTIEVSLPDCPDCRVMHRRAYVDQPASLRQAQHLRSRMVFGGAHNPLGVRIEVTDVKRRFRLSGPRRYRVGLDVQIPYGMLDLVDRGDVHWGKVVIAFFNQGELDEQSRLWSHEQPITLARDRYREAVTSGYFSFKTTLEIRGDAQRINVAVQDLVGGQTSLVPQEFDF